jgi:hypothetical protein
LLIRSLKHGRETIPVKRVRLIIFLELKLFGNWQN